MGSDLFPLVTFEEVASSSTEYATGFFNQFSPFIWIACGIAVAVALLRFLFRVIVNGFHSMTEKDDDPYRMND